MLKKILFTFLIFYTTILFAKPINYYVSTFGKDSNNGKSTTTPFKNIQTAATLAKAGDTVYIMGGTYHEAIEIKHSGSKNNPIHFTNYKNQTVVIDGKKKLPTEEWRGLLSVMNQSHIKISGLSLKNSLYAGVFIVDSEHISIVDVSTYDTFSSGLGVWTSKHILLDNNRVERACNGGSNECITIGESQHCTVRNNEVKNNGNPENGGEGIDIKDGSEYIEVYNNHVHHINDCTGIYVDGWDKDTIGEIKVYNNRVHDCNHTGMAIATERGGHLQNISFYNNIVYNNSDVGILIGGWIHHEKNKPDPKTTPITNVKLINNTLYHNGGGIVVLNKDIKNLVIRNNICSYNSSKSPNDLEILIENNNSHSNIKIDHNLFQGRGAKSFPKQNTNLSLFRDIEKYDFRLTKNSPAINQASKVFAPNIDYNWKSRPRDKKWDIGAYEY